MITKIQDNDNNKCELPKINDKICNYNISEKNELNNNKLTNKTLNIYNDIKEDKINNSLNNHQKHRKSKRLNIAIIHTILKLQEFIQSIYNIIKEQQNKPNLLNNMDSITEEWIELLVEVINLMKDNLNSIDIVNFKKYLILQQSFNVILFQCPFDYNEKFINSLLLSINMFEQNNFLLLGFICGSLSFKDHTELFAYV